MTKWRCLAVLQDRDRIVRCDRRGWWHRWFGAHHSIERFSSRTVIRTWSRDSTEVFVDEAENHR